MRILIKNIKKLVQVEDEPREKVSGEEMGELPCVDDAWLAMEDGEIVGFGAMEDWPGISDWNNLEVIDARGKMVFPCFCDPHTHIVYAGSREMEFVDRIKGLSYEEIAARGGGILNSARRMQEAGEDELYESAMKRVEEVKSLGTGAVEIKSGYGLTPDSELKMLRVIRKIKQHAGIPVKATFLGAHAIPESFKNDRKGYVDQIINEMLPVIERENLADYIDVFCESNYFSVEETDRILEAGVKAGLRPKIHVNQFTAIGGIKKAVEHNALSVDHLEVMDEKDYEVLKGTETMPTVLPSCSFFIDIPYAPARKMIDDGLPVALATDYNPGSTPSGNIPFVISLACMKLHMTPEEAINASTINAAYAMGLSDSHGSIAHGKTASVIITDEIPSLEFFPYAFGSNSIDTVIINGKIQ